MGPVGVPGASILNRHIHTNLLLINEVIDHIWGSSLVFLILKLGISIGRVLALLSLIQRKLPFNQQLLVDLLDLFIEVGRACIELCLKVWMVVMVVVVVVVVVGLEILQKQIIIQVILTEVLITFNEV